MNLPILARYIGSIRIGDIECGSCIVVKINSVIANPRDHFNENQTGDELLAQFRLLPISVRRKLERLTLVDEDSWPSLVRQVDYLAEPRIDNSNELSMRHSLYFVVVTILTMLLVMALGGYYILLQAHNDRAVSHVLSVVDYLLSLWVAITT